MEPTPNINYSEKYGISRPNMFDRVSFAIQDVLDYDSRTARLALTEFIILHGEESLINLYGFLRYIQTSDKTDQEKKRAIRQVIAHDILGRGSAFMVPRSHSYGEFANR